MESFAIKIPFWFFRSSSIFSLIESYSLITTIFSSFDTLFSIRNFDLFWRSNNSTNCWPIFAINSSFAFDPTFLSVSFVFFSRSFANYWNLVKSYSILWTCFLEGRAAAFSFYQASRQFLSSALRDMILFWSFSISSSWFWISSSLSSSITSSSSFYL